MIEVENQPAVIVKGLYKSFKLPHEQHSGLKQMLVNRLKGKKGYEVQHVLKDVSFEINQGEFFGIVGRNGSGKSTLLKLLAGIYVPDKGSIQINGSLTPFIELGVGFNPELTGRENVFLNGALLGFSKPEMEAMYQSIVDFAELDRFMDQKLKNYSSGMQVRLAFSIAIRAESDILVLDEVLAVGDSAFQTKCFNYFEKLKKEKKTIILVTHDMGSVKRFCSKAVYIENGEMVKEGDPLEIADYYDEANIQDVQLDSKIKIYNKHKLSAKILEKTNNTVSFDFQYDISGDVKAYVGVSVILNGISFAEITTSIDKPLNGKGRLVYVLNTDMFNSGIYQFTASLFDLNNRELLTVSKVRNVFTVNGRDITKGGILKLEDTWVYEQ